MNSTTTHNDVPALVPATGLATIERAPLTPRQEAFALAYATTGIAIESYLTAYNAEGSSRATLRVNAHRLLHSPRVASRIRELQDAAGARALRSTQALVADLEEAVDADPNELLTVWVGSCRYCHGEGHRYQWVDAAEYCNALDAAERAHAVVPDFEGGVGYDFHREPAPDCPSCSGVGINKVRLHTSGEVSPGARRLLRGVELHPDGSLKRLHLHDQMAMRTELHKLRGLHVDRSLNVNVNANVPAFENMSRDEQLAFLQSLKPVP
jgi:phage terminase small subunit